MRIDDTDEIVWVPPMERMLHCGVRVRADAHDFTDVGAGSLRFSFAQSDSDLRAYLCWFEQLAYPRVTLCAPSQAQNPRLREACDGLWDILPFETSVADSLIAGRVLQPIDVVLQAEECIGFDVGWQGGLALAFSDVQREASAQMVRHLRSQGLVAPSLLRPWRHRFEVGVDFREVVEVTLLNALPVPDTRMPVGEFLDFRRQHGAAYRDFRDAFDEMVAEITPTGDRRLLELKTRRMRDALLPLRQTVRQRVGRVLAAAIRQIVPVGAGLAAGAASDSPWLPPLAAVVAGVWAEVATSQRQERLPASLGSIRDYALKLDAAGLLQR